MGTPAEMELLRTTRMGEAADRGGTKGDKVLDMAGDRGGGGGDPLPAIPVKAFVTETGNAWRPTEGNAERRGRTPVLDGDAMPPRSVPSVMEVPEALGGHPSSSGVYSRVLGRRKLSMPAYA